MKIPKHFNQYQRFDKSPFIIYGDLKRRKILKIHLHHK